MTLQEGGPAVGPVLFEIALAISKATYRLGLDPYSG